jgi:hypothetical protein
MPWILLLLLLLQSVISGRENVLMVTAGSEAYDGYSIARRARVYAFVDQGDRLLAEDFVSSQESQRQQESRQPKRQKNSRQ